MPERFDMGFRKALYDVEEKGLDPRKPHSSLGTDGRLSPQGNIFPLEVKEDKEIFEPANPTNENNSVVEVLASNEIIENSADTEVVEAAADEEENLEVVPVSAENKKLQNALKSITSVEKNTGPSTNKRKVDKKTTSKPTVRKRGKKEE